MTFRNRHGTLRDLTSEDDSRLTACLQSLTSQALSGQVPARHLPAIVASLRLVSPAVKQPPLRDSAVACYRLLSLCLPQVASLPSEVLKALAGAISRDLMIATATSNTGTSPPECVGVMLQIVAHLPRPLAASVVPRDSQGLYQQASAGACVGAAYLDLMAARSELFDLPVAVAFIEVTLLRMYSSGPTDALISAACRAAAVIASCLPAEEVDDFGRTLVPYSPRVSGSLLDVRFSTRTNRCAIGGVHGDATSTTSVLRTLANALFRAISAAEIATAVQILVVIASWRVGIFEPALRSRVLQAGRSLCDDAVCATAGSAGAVDVRRFLASLVAMLPSPEMIAKGLAVVLPVAAAGDVYRPIPTAWAVDIACVLGILRGAGKALVPRIFACLRAVNIANTSAIIVASALDVLLCHAVATVGTSGKASKATITEVTSQLSASMSAAAAPALIGGGGGSLLAGAAAILLEHAVIFEIPIAESRVDLCSQCTPASTNRVLLGLLLAAAVPLVPLLACPPGRDVPTRCGFLTTLATLLALERDTHASSIGDEHDLAYDLTAEIASALVAASRPSNAVVSAEVCALRLTCFAVAAYRLACGIEKDHTPCFTLLATLHHVIPSLVIPLAAPQIVGPLTLLLDALVHIAAHAIIVAAPLTERAVAVGQEALALAAFVEISLPAQIAENLSLIAQVEEIGTQRTPLSVIESMRQSSCVTGPRVAASLSSLITGSQVQEAVWASRAIVSTFRMRYQITSMQLDACSLSESTEARGGKFTVPLLPCIVAGVSVAVGETSSSAPVASATSGSPNRPSLPESSSPSASVQFSTDVSGGLVQELSVSVPGVVIIAAFGTGPSLLLASDNSCSCQLSAQGLARGRCPEWPAESDLRVAVLNRSGCDFLEVSLTMSHSQYLDSSILFPLTAKIQSSQGAEARYSIRLASNWVLAKALPQVNFLLTYGVVLASGDTVVKTCSAICELPMGVCLATLANPLPLRVSAAVVPALSSYFWLSDGVAMAETTARQSLLPHMEVLYRNQSVASVSRRIILGLSGLVRSGFALPIATCRCALPPYSSTSVHEPLISFAPERTTSRFGFILRPASNPTTVCLLRFVVSGDFADELDADAGEQTGGEVTLSTLPRISATRGFDCANGDDSNSTQVSMAVLASDPWLSEALMSSTDIHAILIKALNVQSVAPSRAFPAL